MTDRLHRLLAVERGRAWLEVAEKLTVEVAGVPYDEGRPGEAFLRRLVENAALVAALHRGDEVINDEGFPPGELWDIAR